MATDFNKNAIVTGGGIKPSTANTPGDIRTRVELEADILNIPMPFVGMLVYCIETNSYYKITKLKPKKVGFSSIEDAAVDSYESFNFGETEQLNQVELDDILNNIFKTEKEK